MSASRSARLIFILAVFTGVLLCLPSEIDAQSTCRNCGDDDPQDVGKPVVSIAPLSDTFSTQDLMVTVDWCDDRSLDGSSREIKLNGQNVTGDFSYEDHSDICDVAKRSEGTIILAEGDNTFSDYRLSPILFRERRHARTAPRVQSFPNYKDSRTRYNEILTRSRSIAIDRTTIDDVADEVTISIFVRLLSVKLRPAEAVRSDNAFFPNLRCRRAVGWKLRSLPRRCYLGRGRGGGRSAAGEVSS